MRFDNTKQLIFFEMANPQDAQIAIQIQQFILLHRTQQVSACGASHGRPFINATTTQFVVMIGGGVFNPGVLQADLTINGAEQIMSTPEFFNNVIAYCLLVVTPNFIEIWDVCVVGQRSSGIGSVFMGLLCHFFRFQKPLWLIVIPGNAHAAKTYFKNGFKISTISCLNSSDTVCGFTTPNIVMTKVPSGDTFDDMPSNIIDQQMSLFNKYSAALSEIIKKEQLNIYFSPELLFNTDTLTKKPAFETCAGLLLVKWPDNSITKLVNNKKYIRLELKKTFLMGIQDPPVCKLPIGSSFSFHTHPDNVINFNGKVVQVPSMMDTMYIFDMIIYNATSDKNLAMIFIFVHDGFFVITASSDFHNFLHSYTKLSPPTAEKQLLDALKNSINRFISNTYLNWSHETSQARNLYIDPLQIGDDLPDLSLYTAQMRTEFANMTCEKFNTITVKNIIENDSTGLIPKAIKYYLDNININAFDPNTTRIWSAAYYPITPQNRVDGMYFDFTDVLTTEIGNLDGVSHDDPSILSTRVDPSVMFKGLATTYQNKSFTV